MDLAVKVERLSVEAGECSNGLQALLVVSLNATVATMALAAAVVRHAIPQAQGQTTGRGLVGLAQLSVELLLRQGRNALGDFHHGLLTSHQWERLGDEGGVSSLSSGAINALSSKIHRQGAAQLLAVAALSICTCIVQVQHQVASRGLSSLAQLGGELLDGHGVDQLVNGLKGGVASKHREWETIAVEIGVGCSCRNASRRVRLVAVAAVALPSAAVSVAIVHVHGKLLRRGLGHDDVDKLLQRVMHLAVKAEGLVVEPRVRGNGLQALLGVSLGAAATVALTAAVGGHAIVQAQGQAIEQGLVGLAQLGIELSHGQGLQALLDVIHGVLAGHQRERLGEEGGVSSLSSSAINTLSSKVHRQGAVQLLTVAALSSSTGVVQVQSKITSRRLPGLAQLGVELLDRHGLDQFLNRLHGGVAPKHREWNAVTVEVGVLSSGRNASRGVDLAAVAAMASMPARFRHAVVHVESDLLRRRLLGVALLRIEGCTLSTRRLREVDVVIQWASAVPVVGRAGVVTGRIDDAPDATPETCGLSARPAGSLHQ
eukprot:365135-Chlamydomonas_euryale.AAC.4